MKLSDYAKANNLTYRTAWNHWKSGKLNGRQLHTGTIVIDSAEDSKVRTPSNSVVIYCRVSSSENKNNLEAQASRLEDYCAAKGYMVSRVVNEVGSGINDSRPKLLDLMDDNSFSVLVVEHKDRLTRFGFNYLEKFFALKNQAIEVINQTSSEKEDLIQDFVSIVTSFCARLYGLRRSKRNTERLIRELNDSQDDN